MKARKVLSILIACMMAAGVLSACGDSSGSSSSSSAGESSSESASSEAESDLAALGLDENLKFTETRQITVEVYDRGNDGGSDPTDNTYTEFIKQGMLEDHNVEVTFVSVPRWTEDTEINNLLAAGNAPDVCVTYSYPTILTYANMGGVVDMAPYLEQLKDSIPNLWGLLGDANIYWNQDPEAGTIWAIEAFLRHNARITTFVRADWLTTLGLSEPTSNEEYEDMLYAFKDNAETLLGADASKMIPFMTSFDIGWQADLLNMSYVPEAMTDKEAYINGFDDRHFLYPNYKEGIRKLNEWYNAGLIWQDFSMYPAGDKTGDNLAKSGYVGSFMHNWDYPYRDGEEGIQMQLQKLVGEEASFVAIDPFKNDAGEYRKFLANPIDRKLFFPATNDEPIASLLYLDWISTLENRMFLQFGEEGVTHETQADGSYKTIAATGKDIMNSGNNIDYTITMNGIDMGDEDLTMKTLANNYAGIDPELVIKAYEVAKNGGRVIPNYNVGQIAAEEGMGPALKEKRDNMLNQAVTASTSDFDSKYDAGMADYLASGGQAIIDERAAKFAEFFE